MDAVSTHTRFSDVDLDVCLHRINASQQQAHQFLKTADWVFITLGSAFVYELENKSVVANCHKVHTDKFKKKLGYIKKISFHYNNKLKLT